MSEKSYEDGIHEGELRAVKAILGSHKERLDMHSVRLRWLERIIWGFFGIVALLQILPNIQQLLK